MRVVNVDAIATLLEEMHRFYGATDAEPFDLRVRQINDALFGTPAAAYGLLAWENAKLVGIAAYSFLWPAVGLTRSLYLKELYVAQASRQAGTGQLLMRSLFEVAAKHACSRVEWTTDQDNAGAQAFYRLLGVQQHTSKLFYRVQSEELRRAAR